MIILTITSVFTGMLICLSIKYIIALRRFKKQLYMRRIGHPKAYYKPLIKPHFFRF